MINNYENYTYRAKTKQGDRAKGHCTVVCAHRAVSYSYLRSFTEFQLKFQVSFFLMLGLLFFSLLQILDEVEKRRAISPALVQPFMRGIMEAPFPAPGRTITVKNFLPGSGTEVRGLGGDRGGHALV